MIIIQNTAAKAIMKRSCGIKWRVEESNFGRRRYERRGVTQPTLPAFMVDTPLSPSKTGAAALVVIATLSSEGYPPA
jgi:hypothetical protein